MGEKCNFAHSDLELREQPDLMATRLCFRFAAKGRCNKGAACTFAHGKDELRSLQPLTNDVLTHPRNRGINLEPIKVKVQDPDLFEESRVEVEELQPQQILPMATGWTYLSPPPGLEHLVTEKRGEVLLLSALIPKECESASMASTSCPSPRD